MGIVLDHIKLGLIGYPLSHSLSPILHESALEALNLKGDYELFESPPDSENEEKLGRLISQMRSGNLQGLNVTIPYKEYVIQFLDEVTPVAKTIGAVNTLFERGGRIIGDNTDAAGFSTDLYQSIQKPEISAYKKLNTNYALLIGAGGAARAVVYSLIKDGWNIVIAARRRNQAQELAQQFKGLRSKSEIKAISISEINYQIIKSLPSLIVNSTPVGMWPDIEFSPWPIGIEYPKSAFIYDLVYNPGDTKLIRDARIQGLKAKSGIGMLVEQAALSFKIWTGINPPRKEMCANVSNFIQ